MPYEREIHKVLLRELGQDPDKDDVRINYGPINCTDVVCSEEETRQGSQGKSIGQGDGERQSCQEQGGNQREGEGDKMEACTIYFVTGANRGIGFQLTRTLLLRENVVVIATKRSLHTVSADLEALPTASGSKLIVIPLAFDKPGSENGGEARPGTVRDLVARLQNVGVERIDVLILNAGAATSFESVRETRMEELQAHFEINTMWPVQIYQVLRPLLLVRSQSQPQPHLQSLDQCQTQESGNQDGSEQTDKVFASEKKIVYISSSLGSIGGIDDATPSLAYGISKAGANYFVRKVRWVKTNNGQAFADSVGVEEPPIGLDESVEGVLRQIDTATRETSSGSFVSYNGTVIPW
ncbi:hypothetical protein DSL72_005965 [Monilinia vaccinii-corymbosi]|uniref:Ketoreductase (KR) domain-containing protein n=1 Tax=Monilinia vaccinii-corymbosi TaxID=61207 RepID=A0A8A3PH56_9HELO|nr:hypothetical protein DSL72_005965 [Monilinia vaccinii-corymbosi]